MMTNKQAEQRRFSWAPGQPLPADLVKATLTHAHTSASKTPIILVDGLSGAGKSTFALALRDALNGMAGGYTWRIIGPDEWYRGWQGLVSAQSVTETVMADLRAGRIATYRPWDWEASTERDPKQVLPGVPTIVEGCGALTERSCALADYVIWVEAEGGEPVRYDRAIARDGDTYRPHWRTWAEQDDARLLVDQPQELADAIVLT